MKKELKASSLKVGDEVWVVAEQAPLYLKDDPFTVTDIRGSDEGIFAFTIKNENAACTIVVPRETRDISAFFIMAKDVVVPDFMTKNS